MCVILIITHAWGHVLNALQRWEGTSLSILLLYFNSFLLPTKKQQSNDNAPEILMSVQ